MYTVLIVDDDPGIRKAAQASIELVAGWQTLLADSGPAGLDLAQTQQPDAILLDVVMPAMDGMTTLYHLQANPLTQPIPVILFTSLAAVVWQPAGTGLPITGIIPKPFEVIELVQQMRSLLHWYN